MKRGSVTMLTLLACCLAAPADTVVVGRLPYRNVKVVGFAEGVLQVIVVQEEPVRMRIADVTRMAMDGMPAFNQAEEAASAAKWPEAKAAYETALKSADEDWRKMLIRQRLAAATEAAERAATEGAGASGTTDASGKGDAGNDGSGNLDIPAPEDDSPGAVLAWADGQLARVSQDRTAKQVEARLTEIRAALKGAMAPLLGKLVRLPGDFEAVRDVVRLSERLMLADLQSQSVAISRVLCGVAAPGDRYRVLEATGQALETLKRLDGICAECAARNRTVEFDLTRWAELERLGREIAYYRQWVSAWHAMALADAETLQQARNVLRTSAPPEVAPYKQIVTNALVILDEGEDDAGAMGAVGPGPEVRIAVRTAARDRSRTDDGMKMAGKALEYLADFRRRATAADAAFRTAAWEKTSDVMRYREMLRLAGTYEALNMPHQASDYARQANQADAPALARAEAELYLAAIPGMGAGAAREALARAEALLSGLDAPSSVARLDAMRVVIRETRGLAEENLLATEAGRKRLLAEYAARNPAYPELLGVLLGSYDPSRVGMTPKAYVARLRATRPVRPDFLSIEAETREQHEKAYAGELEGWTRNPPLKREKVTWPVTVTNLSTDDETGEVSLLGLLDGGMRASAVFRKEDAPAMAGVARGDVLLLTGTTDGADGIDYHNATISLVDCALSEGDRTRPEALREHAYFTTTGPLTTPFSPVDPVIFEEPAGRFRDAPLEADEVVFVVDCSGSMARAFRTMQSILARSIGSLGERQHFSVLLFSGDGKQTQITALPEQGLIPATPENIARVVKPLTSAVARGKGAVIPALDHAITLLDLTDPDASKMIILISDGTFHWPGNAHGDEKGNPAVLAFLKERNPEVERHDANGQVRKQRRITIAAFPCDCKDGECAQVMNEIGNTHGVRLQPIP